MSTRAALAAFIFVELVALGVAYFVIDQRAKAGRYDGQVIDLREGK